jgi:hypothetical protein
MSQSPIIEISEYLVGNGKAFFGEGISQITVVPPGLY